MQTVGFLFVVAVISQCEYKEKKLKTATANNNNSN